MEDKVLWSGKLGNDGVQAEVAMKSGNLTLSLSVNSKTELEALKALIPGQIDDAIISVVEAALGV